MLSGAEWRESSYLEVQITRAIPAESSVFVLTLM